MKITWVDNPTYINDSFINDIKKLGEFRVFNDLPDEEQLIERLNSTDIAIVEWSRITKKVFDNVTRCKYIILVTTSYDNVDLDVYNQQEKIIISNCPKYSSVSVAEWIITCALTLNRNILPSNIKAKEGENHLYTPFLSNEIRGKTMGLIGLGDIAKEVTKIALSLGLKVIGTSKSMLPVDGVEVVTIEKLLSESDFVSIQVPSTSAKQLINKSNEKYIKKGQIMISCSRECLVDINILNRLLTNNTLRGLALDDLNVNRDHEIWFHDNLIVTTGIAWYTDECRKLNLDVILDKIENYLNDKIHDDIGK